MRSWIEQKVRYIGKFSISRFWNYGTLEFLFFLPNIKMHPKGDRKLWYRLVLYKVLSVLYKKSVVF